VTISPAITRLPSRLLHKLREALPPTIFFFLGFNLIVLTTNLLVAQYSVAVSNFMLATVAALVVGKAVLTARQPMNRSQCTAIRGADVARSFRSGRSVYVLGSRRLPPRVERIG
jgi:hypothetical protein